MSKPETAHFPPEAFEQLALEEEESFWYRARNRLIAWTMENCFPRPDRYCEIGCGTGYVTRHVASKNPAAHVVALEYYPNALNIARARTPRASFVRGDVRGLPFAESFDLVGAFDVIEHLDDDVAAMREINRILRPGGGLLITVPQHQWMWSFHDEVAQHYRRYGRTELLSKLTAAGFEPVYWNSFVTLLLPAMWLSRRAKEQAISATQQLQSTRRIRFALAPIMYVEHQLVRAGVRWPVGGSLIVAARKPVRRRGT